MYELLQFFYQDQILLVIFSATMFIAALIFFYNVLPDPESIIAIKRLEVEDHLPKESKILIIKLLRPFLSILLTWVIKIKAENYRKKIKQKLIVSSLTGELNVDEFIAFKIVTTVLIPALATFLLTVIGFNVAHIVILGLAVLGFYYPDIWINSKIRVRKIQILRHLPYAIDILTLSVEAGLDFIAALTRLIQKTPPNALTDEFTDMLKEIRLGIARADALRNMANRLQIEEISSLATLLIQADRYGAAIGPVLRAQSDQIRTNRFHAAEQAGAKASQLILLPMVLFIFPVIFIVILGPYFILYQKGMLF